MPSTLCPIPAALKNPFRTPTSLAAACLATALALPALAQDCALSLSITPSVITTGQAAKVSVAAEFPSAAYAFASSHFDLYSTSPTWGGISSGVIAGANVLGASASQQHQPQMGIHADPSNPIRVWGGVIKPTVAGPALVEIEVDPADFWFYPSDLTSSPAQGNPKGSSDYLFVDPVPFGVFAAAPARGSVIFGGGGRDILIGGRGDDQAGPIMIGLLVPSVNAVRTAMSVSFDTPPDTFTTSARAKGQTTGQYTVTFGGSLTYAKSSTGVGYLTLSNPPTALDGTYGRATYELYMGGVFVGGGDMEPGQPSFTVGALPEVMETRLEHTSSGDYLIWRKAFGNPTAIHFFNGRVLTATDMVVRHRIVPNNLHQMTLSSISVESTGSERMVLKAQK